MHLGILALLLPLGDAITHGIAVDGLLLFVVTAIPYHGSRAGDGLGFQIGPIQHKTKFNWTKTHIISRPQTALLTDALIVDIDAVGALVVLDTPVAVGREDGSMVGGYLRALKRNIAFFTATNRQLSRLQNDFQPGLFRRQFGIIHADEFCPGRCHGTAAGAGGSLHSPVGSGIHIHDRGIIIRYGHNIILLQNKSQSTQSMTPGSELQFGKIEFVVEPSIPFFTQIVGIN